MSPSAPSAADPAVHARAACVVPKDTQAAAQPLNDIKPSRAFLYVCHFLLPYEYE